MPCDNCSCSAGGDKCSGASTSASVALPRSTRKESETTSLWPHHQQQQAAGNHAKGLKSYGSINCSETTTSQVLTTSAGVDHDGEGPPRSSAPVLCERDDRAGICCRELNAAAEERTLIDPDVVRDIIIGCSDGLTVPFALTAGLSGVGSTRLVVLAGLAELVSGAISMGVGGFLSAQAEGEHYRFMARQTHERVLRSCSSAVSDEVCKILGPYGVPDEIAALVANKLAGVESGPELSSKTLPLPVSSSLSSNGRHPSSADEGDSVTVSDAEQVGLTPFLLRLGQGLEPVSSSRAWQSALIIGTSYFLGGLLPLFPYIFLSSVQDALAVSVAVTALTLLVFGVVKQRCTGGKSDMRGYTYGALSTLAVGGLAAGASWAIVRALEGGKEGP